MKKTCKIVGRDGKERRALKSNKVTDELTAYVDGTDTAAWSFALGLCHDSDEAGELVQEACYRALKANACYKGAKPVKSWLFSILRNAFLDSRRRKERKNGVSLNRPVGEGESALVDAIAGHDEPVLDRLEREEKAARVRKALRRLERRDRQVLILCIEEQVDYRSAAKIMRVPTGTLRSRLFRARGKFRRLAVSLGLY
jgi:RNA polymerase sigma-70 factor (ECF subfamily)